MQNSVLPNYHEVSIFYLHKLSKTKENKFAFINNLQIDVTAEQIQKHINNLNVTTLCSQVKRGHTYMYM